MRLDDELPDGYPFVLPAVRHMSDLRFDSATVLVGDNGTGKSTLVEAIALRAGFNPEGGSKNLRFKTHDTHSVLHEHITISWRARPRWGWFLRAESFYGMASAITLDGGPTGVQSLFPNLHDRSHGESFLALIKSRFEGPGLYLMDEPESALSFGGQLQLLRFMHDAISEGAQFVIATHSPILMAFPGASIYELDESGAHQESFDDLEVVEHWRTFLDEPNTYLRHLLTED